MIIQICCLEFARRHSPADVLYKGYIPKPGSTFRPPLFVFGIMLDAGETLDLAQRERLCPDLLERMLDNSRVTREDADEVLKSIEDYFRFMTYMEDKPDTFKVVGAHDGNKSVFPVCSNYAILNGSLGSREKIEEIVEDLRMAAGKDPKWYLAANNRIINNTWDREEKEDGTFDTEFESVD